MAVLIEVRVGHRVCGRCDERCYDGMGGRCSCCCGGVNHGQGLNKAIGRTKRLYLSQIADAVGVPLAFAEIRRPKVQPRLFE